MLHQKKVSRAGSVTIPAHMRRDLAIEAGEVVDISYTNQGDIVLSRSKGHCLFCKSDQKLVLHTGRFVCKVCIEKLTKEAEEDD